jgi:ribosomal protein L7/L12
VLSGDDPVKWVTGPGAGLRRLIAGRHTPRVAPFLVGGLVAQVAVPPDAGFGHAVALALPLAVFISVSAGLVRLDGYAEQQAMRQALPRPRWQYLLSSLAFLGLSAAVIMTAAGPSAHDQRWAVVRGNSAALVASASGLCSLIMLGRAAAWGRFRRLFWRHQPHWTMAQSLPPAAALGAEIADSVLGLPPDVLGDPAYGARDYFDIILQAPGDRRILVIRAIRSLTNLRLKEAKDLVDTAPQLLLEHADRQMAARACTALMNAGATVAIR